MKYGLLPRQHDQRIPHYSSVRSMRAIQIPVLPFDMSNDTLPDDIGVKLNDRLGCCAIAGPYTLMQIAVKQAMGSLMQIPDQCVEQAYAEVGGYRRDAVLAADGSNPTDQGCALQDVLKYWLNVGFPMPDGSRHKILGFVEVDPRNKQDMCEVAMECAATLIGMEVPRLLPEDPGSSWGADLGPTEGRHCIVLPRYNNPASPTFGARSWGDRYSLLPGFDPNIDEAYGVIDPYFVKDDGKTPWNLDLAAWEALMQAIREQV